MADPIRILLVDDHPLMLMGIRAMLEGQTDIEIVGTAADGAKALAMLSSMERLPNVMLLDIMMPGMDGIELARRMRAEMPDVALLVLSSDTSLATLEPLLNIGIDGFLSKGSDKQTMLSAIRSVVAGYEFFGTDIARLIERSSLAKKASDLQTMYQFLLQHAPVPTGIVEVVTQKYHPSSATPYNLMGSKVSASYKGLVIVNGKKVVKK